MFNGLRTTGGGDAPWPYLTTNITGNRNLLEWCWELEIARFVLVSTTASPAAKTPLREDADARRPLSPYAGSKKAAEAMAYSYHSVHGLDVTVLRF